MKPLPLQFLMPMFAGWVNREQQGVIEYLREENRVLREQLRGRRIQFTSVQRRRLARRAQRVGRRGLAKIATVVTPDTLLRWYRQLVAQKYDDSQTRGPGRPTIAAEIEQLSLRMARDNPDWGYTRIQGALHNLGHEIARNTVKRVLHENGIDPVGMRRTTWRTFIRGRWGAIAGTDFFSVEVVTWRGLVRYFVLFAIDLKSRRVEIAGVSPSPDGEWMNQMARNLMNCELGFLSGACDLIHVRDPLFTERFSGILKNSVGLLVRLPPEAQT